MLSTWISPNTRANVLRTHLAPSTPDLVVAKFTTENSGVSAIMRRVAVFRIDRHRGNNRR